MSRLGELVVVRNPRARSLKLALDPVSGAARLTLPRRAPLAAALEWAEGQHGWVAEQRARLPAPRPFVPGARVPVGGEDVEIVWNATSPRTARLADGRLHCGGPREGLDRRIERWLRREALRLLTEDTGYYAARAGVSVERVAVGDPRSRWGSCSSRGAIRYSWRLILAPAEVRRATVAHEVAHRLHMHHGPEFHAAVERLYGADPTPARRWLKANGVSLHWFGRYS